jgi:hypothetical protein
MEFRVASGTTWMMPELSLQTCAERVANAFAKPHSILEMTEDSRGVFLGYQTLLNVKKPPTAFTLI